jgi:hypothetical protein
MLPEFEKDAELAMMAKGRRGLGFVWGELG